MQEDLFFLHQIATKANLSWLLRVTTPSLYSSWLLVHMYLSSQTHMFECISLLQASPCTSIMLSSALYLIVKIHLHLIILFLYGRLTTFHVLFFFQGPHFFFHSFLPRFHVHGLLNIFWNFTVS